MDSVQNGNAFTTRAFASAGGVAMVVRRSISLLLVLALLVGSVRSSYATVATGALTDRGVFSLTAAGAAKLGLAEAQIAAAVRVLGMLGRVSTAVTVGFVAYEITSGLWDWWTATYEPGSALTVAQPAIMGTFGVQSGAGIFDCLKWQRLVTAGGAEGTFDFTTSGPCPSGAWFATVGQTFSSYVDSYGMLVQSVLLHGTTLAFPSAAFSHAAPGSPSGRADLVVAFDSAKASLQATSQADLDLIAATAGAPHPYPGSALTQLQGILDLARSVVSGGVPVTGTDVTHNNPGASSGTMPGAIPGGGESTAPTTPSTDSGIAAAAAAISAAIAASQAAVVSAINAASTSAAASAAAVVSAVQAVAAPIVAAIAASQAAVVSAVNSVTAAVSGITSHVDQVKVAVDGVKSSVDSSAAADVARDQAATAAAAAAPSPAFVCPQCSRVTSWAALFASLQGAAAGAPIFALVSRLAWPGVGTVQRTWNVGSWQGHAFSVNLDSAGIGTAITVVRFVVVGGAVIVAYMIIFG